MDDKRTLENINKQLQSIERNNQNNLENMTSIEMLLTSDNNSRAKNSELSDKFNRLKDEMERTFRTTNEILGIIDTNNN